MIYDCMEVYVYDILVKFKTREAHHEALRRVLERALKYNLKMNPKKCVFGLSAGPRLYCQQMGG